MSRAPLLSFVALLSRALLVANPSNLQVSHGSAELIESPHMLEVKVSDLAILHWDTFSIDPHELVRYIQPGCESRVLNRVVTSAPSQLLGKLEANGKVYLINPNGVLVGENGSVNTGGFLASTLDVCDGEFLRGETLSFQGSSLTKLTQLGKIECSGGDVVLLARVIEQKGEMIASQGSVRVGVGREIYLKPKGEDRLLIKHLPFEGVKEGDGLHLDGTIKALSAEIKAEGSPYVCAIHQKGVIEASGVKKEGGRVFLVAEEGALQAEGKILAKRGDEGGDVHLLARNVMVLDGALVDASGEKRGGSILVGGDCQGSNPAVYNAKTTVVEPGAVLVANALKEGDGGKVILWAELGTGFYGNIFAKGGERQGDGGFVEVSGGVLDYQGLADCRAPFGKTGCVLMDPIAITIATPDTNVSVGAITQPTASPSQVSPASLIAQLGLTPVIVQPSSAGVGSGDITVNEDVIYASTNALTFSNQNLLGVGGTGRITVSPGVTINNSMSGDINFLSVDTILVQGTVVGMSGNVAFEAVGGIFVGGNLYNSSGPAGFVGSATNHLSLLTTGSAGDIVIRGGSGMTQQSVASSGTMSVSISSSRDVILQGDVDDSSVLVAAPMGSINVTAARDVAILGGMGMGSFAGVVAAGSGTVQVTAGRNLDVIGGNGMNAYATVFAQASVRVQAGGNLTALSGGAGAPAVLSTLNLGSLGIDVGGNIVAQGSVADMVNFLVPLGSGSLAIRAGGDISLGLTLVSQTGTSTVLVQAGRSLTLDSSTIQSRFKQISLVVDAQFPSSPSLGSGAFVMDSLSGVQSIDLLEPVPIRIFTSRRSQNTILGTLNGQLFSPGTLFDNASSTEQWGVYYFSAYGGSPYTVFYKDTPFTFPPRERTLNEFTIAMTEALQEWRTYDEWVFEERDFVIGYDAEKYQQIMGSKVYLSWVSVVGNQKYPWMRRMYRTYNTKRLDPL